MARNRFRRKGFGVHLGGVWVSLTRCYLGRRIAPSKEAVIAKRPRRFTRKRHKKKKATTDDTNQGPQQKDDAVVVEGIVVDSLPNARFKVEMENGHQILAHISGAILHFIAKDGVMNRMIGHEPE